MSRTTPVARPLGRRSAGLLFHPTSLPGSGPAGDLDPTTTDRLLDWMEGAGQSVWQMLPVTVAGYADSPYDARSATAGEPALISLGPLRQAGLLPAGRELRPRRSRRSDLHRARGETMSALGEAWARYRRSGHDGIEAAWESLRDQSWLDAWSLFAALGERFGHRSWWNWDRDLRRAEPDALRRARGELSGQIDLHRFVQAVFAWQWTSLRRRAAARGIRLYGDVPIYVSRDSADVWFHRNLFDVGPDGELRAQSGVPPDYFSATGQLWGSPVFRWDRHRDEGFRWWGDRMAVAGNRFDRVRIDHFRGLVAFWRVPGDAADARPGQWVQGPGIDLFRALARRLGPLALIAENLGVITPEVEALRRELGAPGMRVLQFAFDDADSGHLPHRHRRDDVVFTGTHDNAPTRSWYRSLSPEAKARFRSYLGRGGAAHRVLARTALTSVAGLALLPLQDVLGLGASSRMNVPGTTNGNWSWRLAGWDGMEEGAEWLRGMVEVSGRLPEEALADRDPT